MRTNIDIDDALMAKALERSGLKTKKAAVEEGLRLLIQWSAQRELAALRGKIEWHGDLDAMRRGLPDPDADAA